MDIPLYQGPQVSASRTTQATSPVENPFASTFQRSAAAVTQTLSNFEQAVRDRQEYTLEQNRSAALQQAAHELDMELIRRLQIPDGQPDSLYDQDGILILDEVSEIKSRYLSVADSWTSGFISDEGRYAAIEAQQKYRASVQDAIDSKLMSGLKSRAINALQNNVNASYTRGDFDAAQGYVDDAHNRGFLSDAEATILSDEVTCKHFEADLTAIDDPDALASILDNPANAEFFESHPSHAQQYSRKIDALLKSQGTPAQVVEETIVATTADTEQSPSSSSPSKKKSTKITPAQPPAAADGYVKAHYARYGLDLESSDAQKSAFHLLFRKVNSYTHEELSDPYVVFEIETLAKDLKLDKSTASSLIRNRLDKTTAKIPEFSPRSAVEALKRNYTANTAMRDYDARFPIVDGMHSTEEAEDWKTWQSTFEHIDSHVISALEMAEEDFNIWYAQNMDADPVTQARAFQGFLNGRKNANPFLVGSAAHGWNHLDLYAYFRQYDVGANYAGIQGNEDRKRMQAFQEAMAKDNAIYDAVSKDPAILAAYYRHDYKGLLSRHITDVALNYQAANIRFYNALDPFSSALTLPDTNKELIIYRSPDPEKTGSISRQDSIIVKQDGDTFPVRIIEHPSVKTAVPSVALQKKLRLIGKTGKNIPTHVYFGNNVLTFTHVSQPKQKKTRNKRASQEEYPQEETSTYSMPYPDDGLVPPDEYGEGLFPDVPISAENEMPDTDIPL